MRTDRETKRLKIALLMAGLVLCVAVLPSLPVYFYIFLRSIVCGVAVYAALAFRREDAPLKNHFFALAILATLFNPLVPVYLAYLLWAMTCLGTAVYFSILAKKL